MILVVDQETSFGQQVRRLREARGVEAIRLAADLGLAPTDLSDLERGRRSLEADEVLSVAQSLGVSPVAILEPCSLLARLPLARRTCDGNPPDEGSELRMTNLAGLHDVLCDGGHASGNRVNEFPDGLDDADARAEWAREQLGPIAGEQDSLAALATAIEDRLGVDVMVDDLGETAPLGVAITDADFPFIAVNTNQRRSRALFTLAHELAHVLGGDGHALTFYQDADQPDDVELEANAFAASLLMPEHSIRETVGPSRVDAACLARMLLRFGVSHQALVRRLFDLQIISRIERAELESAGWDGLLAQFSGDELRALRSARDASPRRRAPGLLAERCWRGVLDGTISVRPLAGLLHRGTEDLLAEVNRLSPGSDSAADGERPNPPEGRLPYSSSRDSEASPMAV